MTAGHSKRCSIAWCGPRSDGLEWLHQQFADVEALATSEDLSCNTVDELCNGSPRRLVISVASRLDYPQRVIDHLRRNWPEIPWALAVSTWLDGSRRTGIGNVNHLQWPWYRWWDCWFPWLGSSHSDLFGPFPRISSLLADPALQNVPPGILVCNCPQTMESWRRSISSPEDRLQDKSPVVEMTQVQFANWLNGDHKFSEATESAEWLLWDDTCLGGRDDANTMNAACQLFQQLRTKSSIRRMIIAISMPRWHDWQRCHQAGADDLLAKPCIGLPIARVLANVSLIPRSPV
jgi:hypothetical protein